MEVIQNKSEANPPQKISKKFIICQAALRILGTAATLTAIGLMVTSKQTTEIIGIKIDAKYTYSPPFKFFVAVNAVAVVFNLLSLGSVNRAFSNPKKHFILFMIDFVVTMLALPGCTAATTFGFLGRNGNSHTGWMPICDHFDVFCNRVQNSIIFSCVGVFLFVILTIWSAFMMSKLHSH